MAQWWPTGNGQQATPGEHINNNNKLCITTQFANNMPRQCEYYVDAWTDWSPGQLDEERPWTATRRWCCQGQWLEPLTTTFNEVCCTPIYCTNSNFTAPFTRKYHPVLSKLISHLPLWVPPFYNQYHHSPALGWEQRWLGPNFVLQLCI